MANVPAAFRFDGLQVTSLMTGVMGVVLGLVYFGPDSLIRRPLPPGQVSIVVAVERFVPVWPILFTAVGVSLIMAVTARRFVLSAHIFAIGAWAFYSAAVLVGAVLSEPPTPIVMGVTAAFVALIHFGLMLAHQDAGDVAGLNRRPVTLVLTGDEGDDSEKVNP